MLVLFGCCYPGGYMLRGLRGRKQHRADRRALLEPLLPPPPFPNPFSNPCISPQVVAELQKANFDLRLKIVFYEQRLSALSPQEIDQALRKHIQLQVTHETTKVELSRFKRLVAEGDQVVAKLRGEREAGEARERVLEEEVRGARRAEGEKEKTRVRLERKEKELEELRGRGRVGSAAPTVRLRS